MKKMILTMSVFVAFILLNTAHADMLPAKASDQFDYKYEMTALPTTQDLDANGYADFTSSTSPGGSLSVADGILTLIGPTTNGTYLAAQDSTTVWPGKFTVDNGYTVEFSAKIASQQPSTIGVGSLAVSAGTEASTSSTSNKQGAFTFGASGTMWGYVSGGTTIDTENNSDAFHVFRIVQQGAAATDGLKFFVYRDDELIYETITPYLNVQLNRLVFGDLTSSMGGTMLVDYLRFTSGAYAPVPEPATIVLLLSGAGLSLIRRKK